MHTVLQVNISLELRIELELIYQIAKSLQIHAKWQVNWDAKIVSSCVGKPISGIGHDAKKFDTSHSKGGG